MFEEKKELYAAEFLFRETGRYLIKRKKYRTSFPSFDKAVELTPHDLRALMGRSWARAKTTHYTCAIDDVDTAIKATGGDLRAKQLKAYYMFLKTEFEESFVMNERGGHTRKKPDLFIIGAMECAEETERTIGKRGGRALRDHYDIIRKIAWKKAIDLRKGKQWKPRFKKRKRRKLKTDNTPMLYTKYLKERKHELQKESEVSILESLTDIGDNDLHITKQPKSVFQPPQRRTTNIDNLMAEKYLGKMYYDKKCLTDLRYDPRIISPNYEGSMLLRQLARKGQRNVGLRQELLRVRLPFYSIKYGEVKSKGNYLKRQEEELKLVQNVIKHDVETLIKLLKAARKAYLTNTCVLIANKLKIFIDKKSLKTLPTKEIYLKQLYELIGLAHLDTYRLKLQTGWDPAKRINFLFGLPISREPSQDSVIQQNRKIFIDVNKAVADIEKRLANVTTPLETVWVYYDLARLNLQLKKFDLCRFYARKSLNMAVVLNNNTWATNVSMVITSSHVCQRNRNEAKNELIKTLEFAKKLNFPDIIAYINKCITEVETIDFQEVCATKVIQDRQAQITKTLIDKEIKKNIEHLFRSMDAIPPGRRLSIMPGVRFEEEKKTKKTASKPSIRPMSKAESEFQSQLGSKKGLELLEQD